MTELDKPIQDLSPVLIYNEISKTVIGQHEAKKAISNAIYLHYVTLIYNATHKDKLRKPHFLLAGPSGNGKTHLIQEAAKAVRTITGKKIMPMINIDCTSISCEGWTGPHVSDFISIHERTFHNNELALQSAIVYFDEFDKLCMPMVSAGSGDHHKQVQYSLLKLLEGAAIQLSSGNMFSCHNFLFVFSGNFPMIREKRSKDTKTMGFNSPKEVIKHKDIHKEMQDIGLATQLAGRISQMIEIQALSAVELEQIVRTQLIPRIITLFEYLDYTIYIPEEAINMAVQKALDMKTGARGLQSSLDTYIQDELFNTSMSPYRRLE